MITHENRVTGSTQRVTPKQKAALIVRRAIKDVVDSGYFDADMTDSEADAVQKQLEQFESRIRRMLEPTLRGVK